MNEIVTRLKEITFSNVKLLILSLLITIITIVGVRYMLKSVSDNKNLTVKIIESEQNILRISEVNYNITKLDNELLSKCLNRNVPYDTIENDIAKMNSFKDILFRQHLVKNEISKNKLDSLVNHKAILLKQIYYFDGKKMQMDNVITDKSISIVSKSVNKGLFKNNIRYDTIKKNYEDINIILFNKEYNKIIAHNAKELNALIKENNELTLHIKVILNSYSSDKFKENIIKYREISDTLTTNLIRYVIATVILMILFIILMYFLIDDIRKNTRAEDRDKYMISMLIKNAKEQN